MLLSRRRASAAPARAAIGNSPSASEPHTRTIAAKTGLPKSIAEVPGSYTQGEASHSVWFAWPDRWPQTVRAF